MTGPIDFSQRSVDEYARLKPHFDKWEIIKDISDQLLDLMLDLRQSGHPGGSRSKTHALVATLLGGIMRWDIRQQDKAFADRFILVAGHTVPLIYATLAVLTEALRTKYEQTGDERYLIEPERSVLWEDLLTLRRRDGLPGHAEAAGKTMLLKFNTGPTGHGSPPASGEAFALKRAGVGDVRVFAFEGEAGLTAGANHEVKNAAWGLGLDNLYYVVDWNDFGIDDHPVSDVVKGTPDDWFQPYGWRVKNANHGNEWGPVTSALLDMVYGPNPDGVPSVTWIKTRKGRGYEILDNTSHGKPHAPCSDLFWRTKVPFATKYGVEFQGMCEPAPETDEGRREQTSVNMDRVLAVLRGNQELVDYVADTLVEIGDGVRSEADLTIDLDSNPIADKALYDFTGYPDAIWAKPGDQQANRVALRQWGAWVNGYCRKTYGRPLFCVCSADLTGSTNIIGFGEDWGDTEGYGWYSAEDNPEGIILPTEITEFTNAGMMAGIASVNLSADPANEFQGFYGACSTYGSFAYLKYGVLRLFSQMAQDSPNKLGKVLWVVGHSGPETADDSRTHFGIFSPGVTQLFPEGQIVNVYPWEYNEVPVVLGAALATDAPIVAVHLTRPPITIPDRDALGMPSHFAAAKGAYVIREFDDSKPAMGTVIVQGTSSTANLLKILPDLEERDINVKIVAAISHELFMLQSDEYRESVLPTADWSDSMTITNGSRRLMHDWLWDKTAESYSLSSDWDDRWRSGGTLDELVDEAHLSPRWLLAGIVEFAKKAC